MLMHANTLTSTFALFLQRGCVAKPPRALPNENHEGAPPYICTVVSLGCTECSTMDAKTEAPRPAAETAPDPEHDRAVAAANEWWDRTLPASVAGPSWEDVFGIANKKQD